MLFPDIFPKQIAWFFLAFGAICFLVFLYRCWYLLWDWLYAKAISRSEDSLKIGMKWGDIRAAESSHVKELMVGRERDKFVGLLQSGDITAWARINSKTYRDLRPIPAKFWMYHKLEFVQIDGSPETLLAGLDWNGGQRPWRVTTSPPTIELTQNYDIHFNKAELKKIWPSVNF